MIDVGLPSTWRSEKVFPPGFSFSFTGNIVIVTGKDDVISDGTSTVIVSNGDALLGKITGVRPLHIKAKSSPDALWVLCWAHVLLWTDQASCLLLLLRILFPRCC